jgi:hypothetical protein
MAGFGISGVEPSCCIIREFNNELTNSMEQNTSWESFSRSPSKKNYPPFMETEHSLPRSQGPFSGPYSELDESSQQHPALFPKDSSYCYVSIYASVFWVVSSP